MEWATDKKKRGGIVEPSVVGAVLSLGYCCDFLDKRYIKQLAEKGFSYSKIFDSTRGVFTEGGPAFDGAGLFEKSHIQICIRNPNCIQGFFMPREEIDYIDWLEKKAA